MDEVLKDLNPKEVFQFFEQLSVIPRGSSHEKQVSDWFVQFAKDRDLECKQDELNNILIKKPGTAGYENSPTVILHGHMDMVCKKNVGVEHDFLTEGLDLAISDGYIYAKGTTLGADNGIGISYFLAVMDSNDIPHPPLEMAITVMEEMGKVGGDGFNPEWLSGKRMIDLNWHLDNYLLAGCAGDASVNYDVLVVEEEAKKNAVPYSLDVFGLKGGHCEFDIVLERANSIKVIGRLLNNILNGSNARISTISGGVQNNVIPAEANAVLLIEKGEVETVKAIVDKTYSELKDEYSITDAGLQVLLKEMSEIPEKVFNDRTAKTVVRSILLLPNGVISMSFKIKGISECSNNIGLMETKDGYVTIVSTITSGVTTRKHEVMKQMYALAELAGDGVTAKQFGLDAPEWIYDENSELLAVSKKAYKDLFGEDAFVEVMPASLELGMFKEKVPGLDIISIGTETHGVHTPEEKLGIKSVDKVWRLFREVLKNLKD